MELGQSYFLSDTYKSMAPVVFEALIFLKVNNRFWDQDLVCRAVAMAHTERSNKHLKQDLCRAAGGGGDETRI
jgi:hypothetical protein